MRRNNREVSLPSLGLIEANPGQEQQEWQVVVMVMVMVVRATASTTGKFCPISVHRLVRSTFSPRISEREIASRRHAWCLVSVFDRPASNLSGCYGRRSFETGAKIQSFLVSFSLRARLLPTIECRMAIAPTCGRQDDSGSIRAAH
jgi:hypothetical protein